MTAIRSLSLTALVVWGAAVLTLSCGPKKGGKTEKTTSDKESKGTSGSTKGQKASPLAAAIDDLNKSIAEGNEQAFTDLVNEATIKTLKDVVTFSPEDKGGAIQSPTIVEVMDFAKEGGVTFELLDEDDAAGTGTLAVREGDSEAAQGAVKLVAEGKKTWIDFEKAASKWLEKIQSEGLVRGKYLDVVDAVNKALKDKDANGLKNSMANSSLNEELKVRSYKTASKKKLSIEGIIENWSESKVVFEVKDLDIKNLTGSLKAMQTSAKGEESVLYEGTCTFVTEIGKMKLDITDILKAKVAELEAAQAAKSGGKKGKKDK